MRRRASSLYLQVGQLLLKAKADVNLVGRDQWTPLRKWLHQFAQIVCFFKSGIW